jgi:hypothetical protein
MDDQNYRQQTHGSSAALATNLKAVSVTYLFRSYQKLVYTTTVVKNVILMYVLLCASKLSLYTKSVRTAPQFE